jgi:hypothetical protein
MSIKLEDVKRLKSIVEVNLNVSIMKDTRKRVNVEARMIFSKIIRDDLKASYPYIAKYLKKNHATIIHYVSSIDRYTKYDKALYDKYVKIKSLFLQDETDEEVNLNQLKSKVIFLEESLAEVMDQRNTLIDFKEKLHRIMPIVNLVLERVPTGMESTVERKMRTMFNGLDVSQIHKTNERSSRESES